MKRYEKQGQGTIRDTKTYDSIVSNSPSAINRVFRLLNKDAERCEWTKAGNFGLYRISCKNDRSFKYTFCYIKGVHIVCPCCGRKIKVVK